MVNINWSSLGNPVPSLSSNPNVVKNDDGSLELFVVGSGADNALWHIGQVSPGSGWGGWASLGTPPNVAAILPNPSGTALAENDDGRLEAFVVGSDNALWHIWQLEPKGDWSNWDPLGKPPSIVGVIPLPSVRVNDDGRLEVFLAGSDNALWHIWQVAPNGTWSNWESIGRPPQIGSISSPSVGAEEDGRVEVFVTASDNALWHIAQVAPNGTWGTWTSLGRPAAGNAQFAPAVRKNDDGRMEVFVLGSDNALWHIWQNFPNGTWSQWASLSKPPATNVLSAPTVRKNKDGRLEAFVVGSDNALWHIWQTSPNGIWGQWVSLGKPPNVAAVFSKPFVAENDDGRLEAFALGSDSALWHTWQVTPGGEWGH